MNWKTPQKKQLVDAVLALQTRQEAQRFLRDLMTETEIIEFANRLEAASLLTQNVSYSRIQKKTGLSATTIARVSKWLGGTEGGYKTIFSRLHHHNSFFEKRS
ncbi:MAG: hypothetical protein A3J06_00425 [Candidatus Moranbacteria bacterium RIFCSPLOWO2_02_FULL_48_19]|nr:MAG: hypothetical protein A3J06_00425 [Candidatus Moranbacteria bacterium RIFCSPLOWO2_02_FULL_48_19]OGI30757.1 MAG: hypothetical protein A3G09_01745 [Candidatus Moranbacteria bacterium RIFCSPLOWO2_12_FULL_48_12]